ncbi:MAG TPA: ATP-binding protein [Gillisia sp.]|nr:ATP-binding protein [Gillisia sp.]
MPNFKRSYKFAIKTSLFITVLLTLLVSVFLWVRYDFEWEPVVVFGLIAYLFSFFIIQYRVEHFIYKRVKKIYDNVTLLDASTLRPNQITTDMATLTREVEKFAEDKKLEIETLKVRETYRKEFMGNVSHELKTPLFTVQGYILTLLDGALKDKSVRKKYLQRASKGVERLIYIVKDLDMITKLESGVMDLRLVRTDLHELVKELVDSMEIHARERGMKLIIQLPSPTYVIADRNRLSQVFINLLHNAINYGREGGLCMVRSYPLGDQLLIEVADDGIGISEEHLPRLFERFYRVGKSRARNEGGSGLGLAIVKHIIEAHGQTITVKSTEGEGTTFSFTLKKAN